MSLVEAKATLKQLLEDRAALYQQLDGLKSNPETADSPETKTIEDDLELRTVQIQDLQQKVLMSDEGKKKRSVLCNIHQVIRKLVFQTINQK